MRNDHDSVKRMWRATLARATGCNLETIRYYEKIGVMSDPPRHPNGYRSYGQDHVRQLRFVMRARNLGFSLEEIRGLLSLVDSRSHSCAEVEGIASAHLQEVLHKIANLQQIAKVLSDTIAQCSGTDIPECPVLDALLD